MHEISQDLPDHFKTKFSRISPKLKSTQGKKYEPMLLSGVSPETPDFFKLRNIPVLTPKTREDICIRLSTPVKSSRYSHSRRCSVDLAGLPTGSTKHKGEFILPYPRISRNLTVDEEVIKQFLQRNLKTRVKRKRKEEKEEKVVSKISRSRPKTAKVESEEMTFIEPKELTQRQSRVLYRIE